MHWTPIHFHIFTFNLKHGFRVFRSFIDFFFTMFFLQSTNKNRYKNNWGNKKTQCKIHVDHQHSIKIVVAFANFDQFNTLFFGRWIIFSAMIYYNHWFYFIRWLSFGTFLFNVSWTHIRRTKVQAAAPIVFCFSQ